MARYMIGVVVGFILATWCAYDAKTDAVEQGWIVIDSRTYRLTDVSPDIQ